MTEGCWCVSSVCQFWRSCDWGLSMCVKGLSVLKIVWLRAVVVCQVFVSFEDRVTESCWCVSRVCQFVLRMSRCCWRLSTALLLTCLSNKVLQSVRVSACKFLCVFFVFAASALLVLMAGALQLPISTSLCHALTWHRYVVRTTNLCVRRPILNCRCPIVC